MRGLSHTGRDGNVYEKCRFPRRFQTVLWMPRRRARWTIRNAQGRHGLLKLPQLNEVEASRI